VPLHARTARSKEDDPVLERLIAGHEHADDAIAASGKAA
jgi:hypothetical protein